MKKVFIYLGIVVLIIIIIGFCYFFVGRAKPAEKIDFGVTFSRLQTEQLGLDLVGTYSAILDDLGVKKIRLIAYWPEIEPIPDDFDFRFLDWQIEKAQRRGVDIILAVGQKLPRWPECHFPKWAEDLPKKEQQDRILNFISEVIKRYKDNNAIKYWQVENEPFLFWFGKCPGLDRKFLDKEIALVRFLDNRPIILTESGEFSTWIGTAKRADIIGTTLYRKVHGKLGYVRYPIPAVFYSRKTALIKKFFDIEKIIVIELQAEPWGPKQNWELSLEEQFKSMNLNEFRKIIDYTKRAGFSEAYLWGAEWWYWLKTKHNDNSIWEEAKKLF